MTLDPRTPVIVGVAQVIEPARATTDLAARPSTLSLMVAALRGALADTHTTMSSVDELVAIRPISWTTADPALLVAQAAGVSTARTRLAPMGGDSPQRAVHDYGARILRGELDAVALVGAETLYTASVARKTGVTLESPTQSADVASADMTTDHRVPFSEAELANHLVLPTSIYPLFENARRFRRGWTLDEQRARLGRLWEGFARVAATNPYAWITTSPSADEIATPSATNRLIGHPYTKLLVANMPVDMGAAVILTSLAHARRLGVDTDRMVFPHCGAEGNDHWFVSEREHLDESPAMAAIWSALRDDGIEADGLGHLDLYSCFPTVVQTAADVLGVDPFDATRPVTLTGGLTFAGGPGNNYVTHSIATLVTRLREDRSSLGLVTGVGWYATKHAWGVYGASPPDRPFAARHVQDRVDATPTVVVRPGDGPVRVESYVVNHGVDGTRDRLTVVARWPDGARVLAQSQDAALMERFETEEMIGASGAVRDGLYQDQ